jgi:adenylate cyclase
VRGDALGKLDVTFEDMGEQQLKNIPRPLRVYRVRADQVAQGPMDAPQPSLALPDKPSIAVLPFRNMSGDPEQEYALCG